MPAHVALQQAVDRQRLVTCRQLNEARLLLVIILLLMFLGKEVIKASSKEVIKASGKELIKALGKELIKASGEEDETFGVLL